MSYDVMRDLLPNLNIDQEKVVLVLVDSKVVGDDDVSLVGDELIEFVTSDDECICFHYARMPDGSHRPIRLDV